ncbi:hypothetical protein [Endothiovibrio diazotrophicus]
MIERNYAAFLAVRERLLATHPDEYVVMREGEAALFGATAAMADDAARERFPDGLYSIQRCMVGPMAQG